jgi:APA family basic amino acid/polyamine antiporter
MPGHARTASALISNALLLNTTILAQSRLPMTMARDRMFPAVFAKMHPRYSTPTVSLFSSAVILSLLCLTSFSNLVAVYSVTQMLIYILIYATLWKLRKKYPNRERPFKIPGGNIGFVLLILPALCIAVLSIAKTDTFLLPALALLSGPLVFAAMRLSWVRRNWLMTELESGQHQVQFDSEPGIRSNSL